jgi:hypothetical protein
MGIYLLGLAVAPIVAHPRWTIRQPADVVCMVSAALIAVAFLRFNGWFAWSDYRQLTLASFGGFSVCAVVVWGAFLIAGRAIHRGATEVPILETRQ